MFDTVIAGGTIYSPESIFVGDIGISGETITEIKEGGGLEGERVIDATGKLVFPGFIDPHVHIHLPFMGTNAIDDHESATKAALVGGTTTIIEMICPGPDDEPANAFAEWKGLAEEGCCCDYTFHLAVVRFDEIAKQQLRELVANEGVQSFKIFLAYKGALDISDENLQELMGVCKELGVVLTAHCENAELIDAKQKQLVAERKTGPEWHEPSRPRNVEAGGVAHLCEFAQRTGASVYVVHTSCGEAVSRAMEAKERGVDVTVEAVAPHLVLDKTYAELPNFEGAKYVMSPPLRDKEEHDALWIGLANGNVSTVGTDHAPFNFNGQKDMGKDNFILIPNGIPSIQERVDLVHTYGVCEGKIDLQTMVDVCSTNVAKQFNMYPRKGAIAVGSDADIVVYDPDYVGTFKHEDGLSKIDYSGFEGMERKGRSDVVLLRGKVVAGQGKCVSEIGGGTYISR
ncbi:MAG: dihydropyrimidinase [Phycisphaerales bacterium]|nr:dihydropyrimidinase [Planctomycetota bacterium]MBL6997845.1 dihydropyrimidinase [Phycisphaerales bacterium]